MDRVEAAKNAMDRIKERSRTLADSGQLPTGAEIQVMQLNTMGAVALLLIEVAELLREKR